MKFYNSVGGQLFVREIEHPTDQLVPELVKALANCLCVVSEENRMTKEQMIDVLQRAEQYLREESAELES